MEQSLMILLNTGKYLVFKLYYTLCIEHSYKTYIETGVMKCM